MSSYTDMFTGKLGSAQSSLKLGALGSGRTGLVFGELAMAIDNLSNVAKQKIAMIQAKGSAMSVADMFDLQMIMNKLSQFSEMSTSIMAAMNTAINSLSRNIKG